jgi:hypothetical protein
MMKGAVHEIRSGRKTNSGVLASVLKAICAYDEAGTSASAALGSEGIRIVLAFVRPSKKR